MNNRRILLLTVALALILNSGVCVLAQLPKTVRPVVNIPGTGLALPQPKGFDKAESFHGFQQPSTGSSVVVTVLPASFSKMSKGFNKSTLATRGMELRSKEKCKIGKRSGLLLHIGQRANGMNFLKWSVVFGGSKQTQMVTATFPESQSEKLSEELREVVLAAVPASNAKAPQLPFAIGDIDGLVPVKKIAAVGKMAAFTKDGKIPTASPSDPMLIVAPSLGKVIIAEQKQFALQRLRKTGETNIDKITSVSEVKIDRASGFEIVALGHDKESKAKLLVYQVILFPKENGYILMTGLVGEKNSKTYLPKFRKLTKTYKSSSE